jgi:hypothetical protein
MNEMLDFSLLFEALFGQQNKGILLIKMLDFLSLCGSIFVQLE